MTYLEIIYITLLKQIIPQIQDGALFTSWQYTTLWIAVHLQKWNLKVQSYNSGHNHLIKDVPKLKQVKTSKLPSSRQNPSIHTPSSTNTFIPLGMWQTITKQLATPKIEK